MAEGVVVDGLQAVKLGICPTEQIAKVVVLPKECVESSAHGPIVTDRPCAHTPAEVVLGLNHSDLDAVFGEDRGRGQSRDAPADDRDPFGSEGVKTSLRCGDVLRTSISGSWSRCHSVPFCKRLSCHCHTMSTEVIMANPNPKSSIGMSQGKRTFRKWDGL